MKAWFTPPIGVPLLILIVVVLVHLFGRATRLDGAASQSIRD